MSIIKEMINMLESDKGDSVYLREIALLMEEMDSKDRTINQLKKELKLRDKEIQMLCGENSE